MLAPMSPAVPNRPTDSSTIDTSTSTRETPPLSVFIRVPSAIGVLTASDIFAVISIGDAIAVRIACHSRAQTRHDERPCANFFAVVTERQHARVQSGAIATVRDIRAQIRACADAVVATDAGIGL